jgi:Flp pilus assembly protein TadD
MPGLTIEEAFSAALRHGRAGRLQEAEGLCRQVLAAAPEHAGALHLLGMAAAQMGRDQEAAALIARAIALRPVDAQWQIDLGNILRGQGQFESAVEAYRRALALRPDMPEAHGNLGLAW